MTKKQIWFSSFLFLIVFAFTYTIYSTWKAIRPAWLSSTVSKQEIVELVEEGIDNGPFIVHPDFLLEVIDAELNNPRVIIEDELGQLLISEPSESRVSLLANGVRVDLLTDLDRPHGLALLDTSLFVAETGQVLVYDYNAENRTATNKQVLLDLPSGGVHWTRTLGIGPDQNLYITVGSSCNICEESDWRRTKMIKYDIDTQELTVYASGLRNVVFFTWQPVTDQLFATEMGRDWLGDDLPPDELNIITEGADYGFPYCYGKNITDPEFNRSDECVSTEPSFYDFIAHEAPLGIDFYEENAVIALHGSWNASEPVGYTVIWLTKSSNYQEREELLGGFLQEDGTSIGRPAGVLVHTNGSIYITDDKADLLYRLIPR